MGTLIKDEDLKSVVFTRGLLSYDVPDKNRRMANLLRRRIHPFALRVNLSLYLFPWASAELVEGTVLEVREQTGQTASANVIPQTAASEPYLLPMVEIAVQKEFEDLAKGLSGRIQRMPELIRKAVEAKKVDQNDTIKEERRRRRGIFRDVKRKVDELNGVCVALRLQDTFRGWARVALDVLEAEGKAISDLEGRMTGQPNLV